MTQEPILCALCEREVCESDDKLLIVIDEKRGPELVHQRCIEIYEEETR